MAKQWHISKHGEAVECGARVQDCPRGAASHFDTKREATAQANEQMKHEYCEVATLGKDEKSEWLKRSVREIREYEREHGLHSTPEAVYPAEEFPQGELRNMDLRSFDNLLTNFSHSDDFGGFGYVGSRQIYRMSVQDDEIDPLVVRDRLEQADKTLLTAAQRKGWSQETLLGFANSKYGRWFADDMFGSDGRHAQKMIDDYDKSDGTSKMWRA